MRASKAIVGVLAGLLIGLPMAEAQERCSAIITKDSISPTPDVEKSWDIQFSIAGSGCAASRGKFEYVVELNVSGGRTEVKKETADFSLEAGASKKIVLSYEAAPGKDVKNVTGIRVTECVCAK